LILRAQTVTLSDKHLLLLFLLEIIFKFVITDVRVWMAKRGQSSKPIRAIFFGTEKK